MKSQQHKCLNFVGKPYRRQFSIKQFEMKKLFLNIFLLISVNSFTQTNLSSRYVIPPQLEDGFQTASLTNVEIDSNMIIAMTNKIYDKKYINIHSVLIIRNNKLVYENYFPGYGDIIAGETSLINYTRDSIHECRSVTKSVISACIGIAITQGRIKSVDEKVFQYFPEFSKYDTGMKRLLTIKHLLTMSSGINWREGDSASTNQENTMMRSADPIEYVLSQPMIAYPGEKWNYNGGCPQLLGAIIKKTTGLEIDSFAKKNLFLPLGITSFKWDKTKGGFYWCASGLRLKPRDMAKFGCLYINNGFWNGKEIIPTSWINESLRYYYTGVAPETNYGYQFWGADIPIGNQTFSAFAAMGNGGQIILVFPTAGIEVVVTAGNFYNPTLSSQTFNMIANEIFPAIKINKTKSQLNNH